MDTELVAALLGALVGGAASLAGSVIINRLQLRREMRIRIYYELIPKLLKSSFTISEIAESYRSLRTSCRPSSEVR